VNVTILGTGAMACLFGARLSAVADVTLVGNWPEGLSALRDTGVVIEEDGRARSLRVGVAGGDEASPPADLVLALVKAWQTDWAAAQLPERLRPSGAALTLQNGLGNLEKLAARAGPGARAYLGVTTTGATLLGPGRVRPGGSGPTHVAGPAWIAALLQAAGFEAHETGEAEVDGLLWGKLAVNCGINALTALLRVPNGELLRRPAAAALMTQAARECAAVAAARGICLPFADAGQQARAVAQRTAINRSSMFQDILRGAPTEVDAINGAVAGAGRAAGVPAPLNEALWGLVKALVEASLAPRGGH
jgi:2-dehydropantoate 2-reductase